MTLLSSRFSNLPDIDIKGKVTSLFQTDVVESLKETIDCRIMLFDGRLIQLENNESCAVEQHWETIAASAKKLCADKTQLALYLPATFFAATPYTISGVKANHIQAALRFQQNELLPGCNQELHLVVHHFENENAANIALWIKKSLADELYNAFSQVGLNLVAIVPSVFAHYHPEQQSPIIEQSENYNLYTQFNNGHLANWQLFYQQDKSLPQWQQWQNIATDESFDSHSNDTLSALEHIESLPYLFIPEKAKTTSQRHSRLRTGRIITIFAVLMLIMISLPFARLHYIYSEVEANYEQAYESSKLMREQRNYIFDSEEKWASYQKFPVVNTLEILKTIERITPKDSWLTSLNYKLGKIEIKGNSHNPAALIQAISQQDEFTNAAFSQTIRKDRNQTRKYFGITFDLTNVDYTSYKDEFFPELTTLP